MKQSQEEVQNNEVSVTQEKLTPKLKSPLVFISHDTRDAELAELFSKLLSSVSAGVLKSFRSSDKKGTQGIEYGIEWYPEIMKKLDEATDVVCLLTQNSTNRPWILYEAGVAKGKLGTTLLGVAIGVPLSQANSGPFAQFQNCSDDEDSLSKLVMQLVKRIPNSEPDLDVIKSQVNLFISKAKESVSNIIEEDKNEVVSKKSDQEAGVARLFEEIKLMYTELPDRIGRRVQPESKRNNFYRLSPGMIEELLYGSRNKNVGFQIVLSMVKSDFPWVYEMGIELLKQTKIRFVSETGRRKTTLSLKKAVDEFKEVLEFTFEHPIMRDICHNSYNYRFHRDYLHILMKHVDRVFIENSMEEVEFFSDDEKEG